MSDRLAVPPVSPAVCSEMCTTDFLTLPIVPPVVLEQETMMRAYWMYIIIAEPLFNPLIMDIEAVPEMLDSGLIFTWLTGLSKKTLLQTLYAVSL